MTTPTPAPPAGRTAPAPKGINGWLIGGLVLVAIILAAAAWYILPVWHPWAPTSAPAGSPQVVTVAVEATVPKGGELPRGTKMEGGKIVAANGGMITAVIGTKGVEKDDLVLDVLQNGDKLVATLKPAKGGKLALDVTAAGLNGVFPTTYRNVERPQGPPDVLEVEIPLEKGVQSVTLYWGRP